MTSFQGLKFVKIAYKFGNLTPQNYLFPVVLKELMTFSRSLFLLKSSVVDIRLGSK